jgi:aminocarboxymuconate-semialdehyde decarboxylase
MTACTCGLVDSHTHWVPGHFPAYMGTRKGVAWPSMAPADSACQRHVMINGNVYRTVPDASWDGARRADDMARTGVSHQVVSPMPELLSYWLNVDDALSLTRFLNDELAALVQAWPRHFTALGAVPLQDVGLAVRELERLMRELGLAGVELGSNIDGKPVSHPDFEPFFSAAESLGAAVFVHALRPCGMDRLVGPPLLEQVLAFPGEVGLAAASFMTSGVLARHPRLRLAFSHGGGALPMVLPRLQHAWENMAPVGQCMAQAPREMARRLFVDNLVYDRAAIRYLMEVYGPTQVMAGSDYPFAIMERDAALRIGSLELDDESTRLMRRDNALRWIGRTLPFSD